MANYITTHGAALRLALRTVNDKEMELSQLYAEGDYSSGAGSKDRALQVIRNYQDTIAILENDLIPEEERWESENGYRDEAGRFYPNGNANE